MTTTTRDVVTRYRLDTKQAVDSLRAISTTARKSAESLKKIDKATRETAKNTGALSQQFRSLTTSIKAIAIGAVTSKFFDLADAATDVTARINAFAGAYESSNSKLEVGRAIFDDIRDIALRLGVGVDTLAASYVKLGTAIPQAEHKELVQSLDIMATTLATTGASTQQVNAVLLQMSQALGASALQGDEFRSVIENAPVLLRAWREAIGKTNIAYKDLSSSGQLTTESFVENLDAIQRLIAEYTGAAEVPLTLARAFQNLRTEVISLFSAFTTATGGENALDPLAATIDRVSNSIKDLETPLYSIVNALKAFINLLGSIGSVAGSGLAQLGQIFVNLYNSITSAEAKIDDFGDFFGYIFEIVVPTAITSTSEAFKLSVDIMRDYATVGIGAIAKIFQGLPDMLKSVWAALKIGFTEAMNALVQTAVKTAEKLANELAKGINTAIEGLNALPLGIDIGKIGTVDFGAAKAFDYFKVDSEDLASMEKGLNLAREVREEVAKDLKGVKERSDARIEEAHARIESNKAALEDVRIRRQSAEAADIGIRKVNEMTEAFAGKGGDGSGGLAKATKKTTDKLAEYVEAARKALKLTDEQTARLKKLMPAFEQASKIFNVPKELLIAMAKQESGFNQLAESSEGALGVMQIMPDTAKYLARELRKLGFANATASGIQKDHNLNILAGARYMAELIKKFGSVDKALAGYNWGPFRKTLQEVGLTVSKLPKETQDFLKNIIPDFVKLSSETKNFGAVSERAGEQIKEAVGEKPKKQVNALGEEMKTLSELMLDVAKTAVSGIQSTLSDTFYDLFSGSLDSAKDFIKSLKDIILKGVAQLAAQLLTQTLVVPIVGSVLGIQGGATQGVVQGATGGVTGGAGGVTGGVSTLSSITSFFTGNSFSASLGKGIATGINKFLPDLMGPSIAKGIGNLTGVSNLALGGASIGGALLGNALFKGEGYSDIGSSIGSTAGAVIGSMILPGIGTFIGGALGGVGGGFLGKVFGSKREKPAYVRIVGAGGQLRVSESRGALPQDLQNAISQTNNALQQMLGVMSPEAQAAANRRNSAAWGGSARYAPDAGEALYYETLGILEAAASAGDEVAEAARAAFQSSGGDLQLAAQAMQELAQVVALEPQLRNALDNMGIAFEGTRDELFAFVDSLGGVDVAIAALAEFNSITTSTGEQIVAVGLQMDTAFKELGHAGRPQTLAEFKSIVTEFYNMGESGAASAVKLSALSQEFAEFLAAMESLEQGFFAAFYSPAEQVQESLKLVSREFEKLGVAVPTTAKGFRDLVEGIDRGSNAGAELYYNLLAIAPEMKGFYDQIDEVGKELHITSDGLLVLRDVAESISDVAEDVTVSVSLQIKELELLGKSEEALALSRAEELKGLNDVDRAIQKRIYALEDEAAAAASVSLQIKELELLGKSEEALTLRRAEELKGLNDVDRATQERIYALEDEADAARAAIDAIQTFADAFASIQDTLAQTRQSISEFGLDNEKIYKLRKEEADVLMESLKGMTDPKQIEETVSQINSLINSGWGLLDDSQKARLKNPMLEYLDEIESLAADRLTVGLEGVVGEVDLSLEGVLGKFSEVMVGLDQTFGAAGVDQRAAAEQQRAAAAEMSAAVAEMRAAVRSIPVAGGRQRGSEVS
jgi:tape measure domain-containing protein